MNILEKQKWDISKELSQKELSQKGKSSMLTDVKACCWLTTGVSCSKVPYADVMPAWHLKQTLCKMKSTEDFPAECAVGNVNGLCVDIALIEAYNDRMSEHKGN